MSMIGIRDMSLIEDPPEDRYPVQTYVTDYDENLIAEGIEREIDRGDRFSLFIIGSVTSIKSLLVFKSLFQTLKLDLPTVR